MDEIRTNALVTLDSIAKHLIQERFLLTALELHTELVEQGKELSILSEYFSNPSNFELCTKLSADSVQPTTNLNRSSSQTTLDSLDWARFSEDGERLVDDRIAVLEFELRKAKETIQGLRDNLTQATSSNEISPTTWQNVGGRNFSSDSRSGDLKPHEVCTLNFLINEYLVMRNYKMTANTFADENDNQDFENWDDVGLNIARPPTLVQWLKEKIPDLVPKVSADSQTEIDESHMLCYANNSKEILHLQDKITELESRCERQELELQKMHRKMSTPHVTPLGTPHGKTYNGEFYENMTIEEKFEDCSDPKVLEDLTQVKFQSATEISDNDENICDQLNGTNHFSDYLEDNVESIEDFIENSPRQSDSIDSSFIGQNQSQLSNVKSNNFTSEKNNYELSRNDDLAYQVNDNDDMRNPSESNEILDPRKFDRLPPLGASNECSPQGVLAGEFIGAQQEEAKNFLRSSTTRETPKFFEAQIFNICFGQTLGVDSRLQNEVAALSLGHCDLLNLVSSSLHNIAPNVILAKREELLPLLVYSISQHVEGKERERLLHLLFNLTKKPDKEQRSTILLGLVCLARVLGPDKLEAELLPQCWEQLTHKHQERRLLVAQSVAILAPYTPPPLRNSLLLSMLLQLLGPGGEKDTVVREAALGSLSLLVLYLNDTEKLVSLANNLVLCLEINPIEVQNSNVYVLYSSLALWSIESGCFYQFICPQVERIKSICSEICFESTDITKRSRISQLCDSLSNLFKGLLLVCPYMVYYLYKSLPIVQHGSLKDSSNVSSQCFLALIDELSAIFGSQEEAKSALLLIHGSNEEESQTNSPSSWSELSLIVNTVLPCIVQSIALLDVSNRDVIRHIINFFSRLCCCLGPYKTQYMICPLFDELLAIKEESFDGSQVRKLCQTKAPLVVYIVGIMACPDSKTKPDSIQEFLSKQISLVATKKGSLSGLHLTITLLLEIYNCQEIILGALWACVVNENIHIRESTASMWGLLVDHVQEAELASKVVPALVTLATDTAVEVRAAAIPPLTSIVANTSSKEVIDKVMLQLECLCEEHQVLEHPALQIAIAQCCTTFGHNSPSKLLHHLFLPCMCRAALEGKGSPEDKLKFGSSLLEAFTALASLPLPDHLVAHFILPPLNQLQKTLGVMSFEHMETITVLTKEYTLRAQSQSSSTTERIRGSLSNSSLSSISSSLSSSVGAMGAGLPIGSGVEDVKNKMSKMFHGKSSSINIQTLFKKK